MPKSRDDEALSSRCEPSLVLPSRVKGGGLLLVNTPAGAGSAATRLGIQRDWMILEVGFANDCDQGLRDEIASLSGQQLLENDTSEVVDAVILWWRDGDGDLVDQLVDSQTYLSENGPIWLLTPKVGRDGHVEASDIQDAAPTAGLSVTSTIPIAKDWIATRIAPRHAGKPAKKK